MIAGPSMAALTADGILPVLPDLRVLLRDAVASGASVGFLPPLVEAEADDYWASGVATLRDSTRVLLVARDEAGGTALRSPSCSCIACAPPGVRAGADAGA